MGDILLMVFSIVRLRVMDLDTQEVSKNHQRTSIQSLGIQMQENDCHGAAVATI